MGPVNPLANALASQQPVAGSNALLAQALSPSEEQKFQTWVRALPWYSEFSKQYGQEPDLNTPDYDYRAAWKAGIVPSRYAQDGNRFHWPSVTPQGQDLKAKNHPTAWMEDYMRMTGKDPHGSVSALMPSQVPAFQQMLRNRYGGK